MSDISSLSRDFGSDNITPVCPSIMAALQAANTGFVHSYGADELTTALRDVASRIFEREVAIYPVATGTAANALALAQLAPPFGGVYCHPGAHIMTDECGAPELFSGGAKLLGLAGEHGKIRPESIEAAVALAGDMGVHHVKPSAVSVTQATELGTVYGLAELEALSAVARRHGLPVHMDGARFANALVHLGCSPAEATWKVGVDVLSLGATKNGALAAEAVVFFDPDRALDFERRRKRGAHLWSKMRYLSCQLLAYLTDDLWLENARQANAMAARVAAGLKGLGGVEMLEPVQANELFVAVSERLIGALEGEGFHFYRWPWLEVRSGAAIRLVTSYATTTVDVDDFLSCVQRLA